MNNDTYISEIIRQVSDIIRNKKISSSKMNEILQVSDDDKYRKHYFMFSSDAKQFCLDLINEKKYPLDITMKMCKVPRKSLRRWSHVGCLRKKGCGRKTKNPQMEEKLLIWYNDIMKKNVNITAKMIRDKAVEISDDKDFLASKGWLEKFKKKNGIQIISNKRVKKEVTFHETENNTIINSVSESKNSANKNESVKENEKDEYEIGKNSLVQSFELLVNSFCDSQYIIFGGNKIFSVNSIPGTIYGNIENEHLISRKYKNSGDIPNPSNLIKNLFKFVDSNKIKEIYSLTKKVENEEGLIDELKKKFGLKNDKLAAQIILDDIISGKITYEMNY